MTVKRGLFAAAGASMAAAAAVAVFAVPSHAITIPPPGQATLTVRDYYDGFTNGQPNIVGQIYLNSCPGAPKPPSWGQTTGTAQLANLPCSADGGPTTKPNPIPTGPYPGPTGF
jgi:hypothetical protein